MHSQFILALDEGQWCTFRSGHFTAWKEPPYYLSWRLAVHQRQYKGFCEKKKKSLPLPYFERFRGYVIISRITGPKNRYKQDRECTHNAALRRVSVTMVVVEKGIIIFCVCVCSLRYPACNAQAPYCYLFFLWLHHIFPHYLTNGML